MRWSPLSRDHRASVLVTSLASSFGVALLGVTTILEQIVRAEHPGVASGTSILQFLAVVFLALSIYVGAIVTANTFATIVAGRTSSIALMRLLGATARSQRRDLMKEGLAIGIAGAVIGGIVGLALTVLFIRILVARGAAPDLDYTPTTPLMVLPVVGVVAATVLASWVGSRGVLHVSPVAATSAAQEATSGEVQARHGRRAAAIMLFAAGGILLVAGMVIGLVSPAGVLIGLVGGILSFTGVVVGSPLILPWALRVVGRAFGSRAPALLASANTAHHPDRSARSAVGLVIGVTLVTTFAVALTSFQTQLTAAGADSSSLGVVVTVFSGLVGFSAVIAAVGLVNNLSLGILQRRRELGLLRALGFTVRQVRQMVVIEAAQLAITSIIVGLVLGTFYGWAGAQSLVGSVGKELVVPTLPWPLVAVLVGSAALLTVVGSVAPSRTATRVTPVEALQVL